MILLKLQKHYKIMSTKVNLRIAKNIYCYNITIEMYRYTSKQILQV